MTQKTVNQSIENFTDNIDEFIKQGRKRRQEHIEKLREANQTEPIQLKGRPFTPEDIMHLETIELSESTKQHLASNWNNTLLPQTPSEMMYARYFGIPIILNNPQTSKNQKA